MASDCNNTAMETIQKVVPSSSYQQKQTIIIRRECHLINFTIPHTTDNKLDTIHTDTIALIFLNNK